MQSNRLTWLLILGACASASGQAGAPDSIDGSGNSQSHQSSSQRARILLTAKTVLVVGEGFVLYPTTKTEQTFKKALEKWGRFHVVDDLDTADLIIVVSEYTSSKPTKMERVCEELTIFPGGSTPAEDATPLWAVKEVGPAFGQRPTDRLVHDLRKSLSALDKSTSASNVPSPI